MTSVPSPEIGIFELKRKLNAVFAVEYMSPEESAYETNTDEEGPRTMTKLVVKQFQRCSEELTKGKSYMERTGTMDDGEGLGRKFSGKQPPLSFQVCTSLGPSCGLVSLTLSLVLSTTYMYLICNASYSCRRRTSSLKKNLLKSV